MRFEEPGCIVSLASAGDRVGLRLDRNAGVDAPLVVPLPPNRKLRKKRGSDEVTGVWGIIEAEASGEERMGDEAVEDEYVFACGDGWPCDAVESEVAERGA